jgi:hypothetical protein
VGPLQKIIHCTHHLKQVPLCVEIVYRALLSRIIDPKFDHTSFFTFISAIFFSASHYINYYKLEKRFASKFAFKTSSTPIHS